MIRLIYSQGFPAWSARGVADACPRFSMRRIILVLGICPSASASTRAWKLEPLPEAKTRIRHGDCCCPAICCCKCMYDLAGPADGRGVVCTRGATHQEVGSEIKAKMLPNQGVVALEMGFIRADTTESL